jgi:Rps23 Pro-64 3,4-dihydroxylase Tpa1-like proline 4-hydroxylase
MEFYSVDGLPIVVIDDFYSELECDFIWKELCFLNTPTKKLLCPEKTGTATAGDGKILKKNSGIFLDQLYLDRSFSNILNLNQKIFSLEKTLTEKNVFFRYLKESNQDATLVQYYENSDYYKSHFDKSIITAISWFYQKPKSFVGGDLIIDNDLKIECKYNRLILFPSIVEHEVEEIKIGQNLLDQNFGRYSISHFISIKL